MSDCNTIVKTELIQQRLEHLVYIERCNTTTKVALIQCSQPVWLTSEVVIPLRKRC